MWLRSASNEKTGQTGAQTAVDEQTQNQKADLRRVDLSTMIDRIDPSDSRYDSRMPKGKTSS
jgi:hypothetical protein